MCRQKTSVRLPQRPSPLRKMNRICAFTRIWRLPFRRDQFSNWGFSREAVTCCWTNYLSHGERRLWTLVETLWKRYVTRLPTRKAGLCTFLHRSPMGKFWSISFEMNLRTSSIWSSTMPPTPTNKRSCPLQFCSRCCSQAVSTRLRTGAGLTCPGSNHQTLLVPNATLCRISCSSKSC
jgi:hypothetical protein